MLNGGLISYISKNQAVVALSLTEAKYIALSLMTFSIITFKTKLQVRRSILCIRQ